MTGRKKGQRSFEIHRTIAKNEKYTVNLLVTDYLALSDNAARQYLDSVTIFSEYVRTVEHAQQYKGGMYWKVEGEYEYLVKTRPDNRQMRIGRRSAETEKMHAEFSAGKRQVSVRLRSLKEALLDAERLNKALRVGRVPPTVISVIQALGESRPQGSFTLVGDQALYAYEAAAGVRILPDIFVPIDSKVRWDARKRIEFLTTLGSEMSVLAVLQRSDKTFHLKDSRVDAAVNEKGFEVDILRPHHIQNDQGLVRVKEDDDDAWPVQSAGGSMLNEAPRFEQIVVSSNGKMAVMKTIAPETFVAFKLWRAEHTRHRNPTRRRQDVYQARIVQAMLSENLLPPSTLNRYR